MRLRSAAASPVRLATGTLGGSVRRLVVPALPMAVLGLVVALAGAPPAAASRAQLTMLEDTAQLLSSGPDVRARTLDEMRGLGVDVVKVRVEWGDIAPDSGSETRPVFEATDPAAYPEAGWESLDDVVRGVLSRGMRPLLMVGPPAPEWATAPGERRGHPGVMRPDPVEFGRFVEAIGRRYSGAAPAGARVGMWTIWNEPNHPQFLQPLSERLGNKMTPSSPHRYRELYLAARAALGLTDHGGDIVLFGEILPIGQSRLGATNTLRPLHFLRELFCVDARYRPLRGSAARARRCPFPFPSFQTSGFAFHPYTRPAGPRLPLSHPDDATIGQIARVERALDLIARTRRVRRGLAIYNTEFGLQTEPPDCIGFGASLANQAAFINEAEYISYTRRRLKTYSNYLLIDDPIWTQFPPGSNARYGGFQTGLRFGANAMRCDSPSVVFPFGSAKRPGYDAFRTPLYVRRTGPRRVEVFGRARPRGLEPQPIEILRSGRVLRSVTARGYFLTPLRVSPGGSWQLRWSFEGQTYTSRRARALADPRPESL